MKESQKAKILAALRRGEGLTKLDMLYRFGCMNGGGRIGELREEGWPIGKDMITVESGKLVARYRMDGELRLL